jgi:hypothetical protein
MQLHVRANLPDSILTHLRKIFDEFHGSFPVVFLIDDVDGARRIKSSAKVQFTDEVVKRIEEVIGKGTVKVIEG